jgi:hypothetical protein
VTTSVEVRCDGDRAAGWSCAVAVRANGRVVSDHRVRVTATDLDRLAPGADDPTALVEASLAFLLEREPPSSILRTFDLPVIGRYFAEYEDEIQRRRTRPRTG